MSGISQCPVCGDLYYGDERDDWQTCSCTPPLTEEQVAALRAEQEASDAERERWRRYDEARSRCVDVYVRDRDEDAWRQCVRNLPRPDDAS